MAASAVTASDETNSPETTLPGTTSNETATDESTSTASLIHLEVEDLHDDERVDKVLFECTALSRTQAARLIREGRVLLDEKPITKPSQKVSAGQALVVQIPEPIPIQAQPEDLPLTILYEDEDLVVVDKASGMVVHPAPGHATGTLVNALLHHVRPLSGIGGAMRPGIVHRLDKDTSGTLVIARNDRTHRALQTMFAAHDIHRAYIAICVRVRGPGLDDHGTFHTRHGRDPNDRIRFTGKSGPREAISHYTVLERFDNGAMLVRMELQTGRTHQIRVHLSEAGCPILGDELYGGNAVANASITPRLALHAAELGFHLPWKEALSFRQALPEDLERVCQKLRAGASWR